MADLREGEQYCVPCGTGEPDVSLMHVRLTEVAMHALEDSRECQCLKSPRADQPNEAEKFYFNVSDLDKDNPQGSFECVQQKASGSEASQLNCLGLIQNKITVCATSDSYLATREHITQAEEDSRSRTAKIIKPRGRNLGRRAVRRAPQTVPDFVPSRRRSTPVNPAVTVRRTRINNGVYQKPYRERVIHLLALRSYKKPELLIRLQKDGVNPKDRDSLGIILQQVAYLNPKDNSYVLKDSLFKDIQKDWPGYTELDKQSLELILHSKLNLSRSTTSTSNLPHPVTSGNVPPIAPQKEPWNPLKKKKRISHLTNQVKLSFRDPLFATATRPVSPLSPCLSLTAASTPWPMPATHIPTSNPPQTDSATSPSTPQGLGMQDLLVDCFSCNSICEDQQEKHTSQTLPVPTKHRRSKRKKHEVVQQKPKWLIKLLERYNCKPEDTTSGSKEEEDLEGEKTNKLKKSPHLDSVEGVKETWTAKDSKDSASPESEDYILKYVPIASHKQRQRYITDFNAEYDEYRSLYSQIQSVSSTFKKLETQWKRLSPKSKEYQILKEEIIENYQKIKKSSPNYYEEKYRCEYLHKKLSHIKNLVDEFDEGH